MCGLEVKTVVICAYLNFWFLNFTFALWNKQNVLVEAKPLKSETFCFCFSLVILISSLGEVLCTQHFQYPFPRVLFIAHLQKCFINSGDVQ